MKTGIERREFLALAGKGMAVAMSSAALSACAGKRPVPDAPLPYRLDDRGARILRLANRAPSSHNAQPWRVALCESGSWRLSLSPDRRLPVVDPAGREMILSLGAFLENLVSAASAYGLEAQGEVVNGGPEMELRLVKGAPSGFELRRIEERCTLRSGFLRESLDPASVAELVAAAGPALWLPMESASGRWIRDASVEAFRCQSLRDDAQRELAGWIRFSDEEVASHGDGLTPVTMEIDGIAGFYVRHFMNRDDVMSASFRQKGIDRLAAQAGEGGGYLVIASASECPADLIDAGRRFERAASLGVDRNLGLHPMSQILEEQPWRDQIGRQLGVDAVQFVVRVGKLRSRRPPVSPRRPLSAFVTNA